MSQNRQVLPYLVKDNLEPKLVQPDWILNGNYLSINYTGITSPKSIKDRLFRVFCSRGTFLRGNVKPVPKSRLLHHFDPYLKLGPFQVEVITDEPYRTMLHNVSENLFSVTITIPTRNLSLNKIRLGNLSRNYLVFDFTSVLDFCFSLICRI